jgi:hypothetical protein
MKTKLAISALFCVLTVSCSKTEIIQLTDLAVAYCPYQLNQMAETKNYDLFFVVASPPKNKDSLLSLLSTHVKSYMSDDTLEKYNMYAFINIWYYKESWAISRNFKETDHNDISNYDYVKYNFATARVTPDINNLEIRLYRKRVKELEFELPLNDDGEKSNSNQKKITFFDDIGGVVKETVLP